jgi:hypothetical protein
MATLHDQRDPRALRTTRLPGRPTFMPDADLPLGEAPPLVMTAPEELADVALINSMPPAVNPGRPNSGQDPSQVTADFLAWREKWARRHRRAVTSNE